MNLRGGLWHVISHKLGPHCFHQEDAICVSNRSPTEGTKTPVPCLLCLLRMHLKVYICTLFINIGRDSCLWLARNIWTHYSCPCPHIQHNATNWWVGTRTNGIKSSQGHHGAKRGTNSQQRRENRATRGQDRCHGWTGHGIQTRCSHGQKADVVEKHESNGALRDRSPGKAYPFISLRYILNPYPS